jgi:hypothetical protein
MKIKTAILTSVSALLVCLFIYYNSSYYISRHIWKHYGGADGIDFLIFDPGFEMRGWGIYYQPNKKVATQLLCVGDYLMVKLSNRDAVTFYIAKP